MRRRDDLTFPMAEHERRLRALRGRMEARGLDTVIISDPENLAYLTEHQTTGYSYLQALVVPLVREPFMVTRALERSNVEARTWVERAYAYDDTGDAVVTLADAMRGQRLDRGRVGFERNSYFMPAHHRDRLAGALDDVRLEDCYGIVEEGRLRKSDCEIEVMRRAARAAEAGMRAGQEAVAPGVSENEIAAAICAAMFRAGGEYPAVLPYVTTGPRSAIGHATWEGRALRAGEHAFLEVGGCFRRYHVAMMRTVLTRGASAAFVEAERALLRALDTAHEILRPGVTSGEADHAIRAAVEANPIGARMLTRSGYSIGIAFAPSWDEGYMLSLKPGGRQLLEAGMTLHVIPLLFGVDGELAYGISDTVHITDGGCASFFDLPRAMTVGGPWRDASAVAH